MADDEADRTILTHHKRWADALGLIWMIIAMGAFVGGYFLMEAFAAPPLDRVQAYILLSTIILVAAIWQAAGLVVARLDILSRSR